MHLMNLSLRIVNGRNKDLTIGLDNLKRFKRIERIKRFFDSNIV